MTYHSETNKPMKYNKKPKNNKRKEPSKQKAKLIMDSKIHHTQKKRMLAHSHHHSKKHLNFMMGKMMNGETFKDSHNMALMSIGK